jgi:predicted DNA-binding transcriptional regulator AlpA
MKRVFNTPEAAEYIGTTSRTLRASRSRKSGVKFDGPKYRKMGPRKVVYLREDLDEWIDNLAAGQV